MFEYIRTKSLGLGSFDIDQIYHGHNYLPKKMKDQIIKINNSNYG